MRLSSLLFLITCLLGSLNARAQPSTHFIDTCADPNDETLFANSACYVDPSYEPGKKIGKAAGYNPPMCIQGASLSDSEKGILKAAHKLAPDYMKARLCGLTFHDCDANGKNCFQLFVIRNSSTPSASWGFWEANDLCGSGGCTTPQGRKQAIGLGVFIAISESLLNGGISSIVDLENKLAGQLLRATGNPRALQFFKSPTTMPELATLDALAHELGHVLLADTDADGFFMDHPRNVLRGVTGPGNDCFGSKLLNASWSKTEFINTKPLRAERWIDFAKNKGDTRTKNQFDWSAYGNVTNGEYTKVIDKISKLYARKDFVSLWAALRPEEDFVETYKYKVLIDKMPVPLTVNFGGADIDVLDFIRNSPAQDLKNKLQCLNDLGLTR